MLKRLVILALVGVFALPAVSEAQFTFGDRTFTMGAGGTSDRKFSTNSFSINGDVGYFWMDNVEASLRQNLTRADAGRGGGSLWQASTRLAVDWHFVIGEFLPFVGAQAGILYGDPRTNFILGPELGLKYFVNQTTYIQGLAEYQYLTRTDDDFKSGRWQYTVGIGYRF
jgi:hypothetical protein